MRLTRRIINNYTSPNVWDYSNELLYEICRKNPKHDDVSNILAKILIIGRVYAAAIERRKAEKVINDENFYIDKVAPKILNSEIDVWFDKLIRHKSINPKSIPDILEAHLKLTELFTDISGLEKRSLASKYLHFHFPNLFYIYDSRALKSLKNLSSHIGRVGRSQYTSDNEYRKLFEKCEILKSHIYKKYSIELSPRKIDKLLLNIVEVS